MNVNSCGFSNLNVPQALEVSYTLEMWHSFLAFERVFRIHGLKEYTTYCQLDVNIQSPTKSFALKSSIKDTLRPLNLVLPSCLL